MTQSELQTVSDTVWQINEVLDDLARQVDWQFLCVLAGYAVLLRRSGYELAAREIPARPCLSR